MYSMTTFKYRVPGIRVPSLREVVAFIKQQELFLLLDLKGTPEEVSTSKEGAGVVW